MSLKILHTADLHLGMKFNGYPEPVKEGLVEARYKVLENLINQANEEQCALFVIAGDLFEKTTVPQKDLDRVVRILEKFSGECVLVMPGNHDYYNGLVSLWSNFRPRVPGKILLLRENRPYSLKDYDLDVVVYPAPCDRKHSSRNNLGWMAALEGRPEGMWHLGIAHGALEGLSPDLNQEYFAMTVRELESLPPDLWLLGHTHLPYPPQVEVRDKPIFNAGTPEPDGMDCSHGGCAWIIEIDEQKTICGRRIDTGYYRFIDTQALVQDETGFQSLLEQYQGPLGARTILRIQLQGLIDPRLFSRKEEIYRDLAERLAYLRVEDDNLRVRITKELIDQEFTRGSFPYEFLNQFIQDGDEEALQIAYEIVREVKMA